MINKDFERYAVYKDSGVEWLGEVPEHWLERRIKDIAILERGKFTHRPRNDPKMYDGEYPFIQTGDVARANKYIKTYKQTLSDKGITVSKKFTKGTLLMAIAANIGDVAILDFDSYLPDSIIAYKPKRTDTNYLFYLFTATKIELNRVKITSTQDNLNLERLNSLVKFIPLFNEQQAIANYLDIKTAQIDRKIELLTQKATLYGKLKQSLINETVTRGLDKTAPMKDSGVEWIGEVPEHWKIKRIKDIFQEKNGNGFPHDEQGNLQGYIPFYKVSDINGHDCFVYESKNYVSEETIKNYKWNLIPKNTIITAKIGEALKKNHRKIATTNCLIDNNCLGLFSSSMNIKFAYYLLKIIDFNRFTNTGAVPSVSTSDMRNFLISLPEFLEQQAIANYLDEKTAHIDRIIETINAQIEKLKELRKTLINDVVTGKIKVT